VPFIKLFVKREIIFQRQSDCLLGSSADEQENINPSRTPRAIVRTEEMDRNEGVEANLNVKTIALRRCNSLGVFVASVRMNLNEDLNVL